MTGSGAGAPPSAISAAASEPAPSASVLAVVAQRVGAEKVRHVPRRLRRLAALLDAIIDGEVGRRVRSVAHSG